MLSPFCRYWKVAPRTRFQQGSRHSVPALWATSLIYLAVSRDGEYTEMGTHELAFTHLAPISPSFSRTSIGNEIQTGARFFPESGSNYAVPRVLMQPRSPLSPRFNGLFKRTMGNVYRLIPTQESTNQQL